MSLCRKPSFISTMIPSVVALCRRGKTAIVEGNLANLEKLVRKGKATPEVLEDRLSKVRGLQVEQRF